MRCLSSQMRDARGQICKIGVGMRTLLDLVTTCRCCVQCRALFFVRVSNAQVCSKAGSGRVCCMSAKVPSPEWCAAAPIDSQRQSRRQCGKKKKRRLRHLKSHKTEITSNAESAFSANAGSLSKPLQLNLHVGRRASLQ